MKEIAVPTRPEKLADGVIHALGVLASIVGAGVLVAMVVARQPALSVLGIVIYATALMALFTVSAAYHMVAASPLKAVLRRCDQATIFVKIAATYTPFALVAISGLAGTGLMIGVWSVAMFGFALKLFFPERLVRFSYVLYLGQGWAALFVIGPFLAGLSALSAVLLGVGGVLYTTGVLFHLWKNLRYNIAIWHGFVLAGASCHFFAVLDTVVLA